MLGRKLGFKREAVTGEWRKLQCEELKNILFFTIHY
jgi:hypothetical protein